jgi:hypothetical protein
MLKNATPAKRNTVDVDTRRAVIVIARNRKPKEVAEVNHETFIRNLLKDKMGWPRREPAPETIKAAARELAMFLKHRDMEVAAAKAKQLDDQAAKDAAVAQGIADSQ